MAGFERFVRHYRVPSMLTMGIVASMESASARLPDASPTFVLEYVQAIHMPTGCIALLEFDGPVLVGALIIDPLCLPRGVKARAIPAFKRDFHLPASHREIIRGR